MALAQGQLFTLPPLISLLIRPPLVQVVVVSGPTVLRGVSLNVIVPQPLTLYSLLALLFPSLLVQHATLIVIPAALEIVLTFLLSLHLVELPAVCLLPRP